MTGAAASRTAAARADPLPSLNVTGTTRTEWSARTSASSMASCGDEDRTSNSIDEAMSWVATCETVRRMLEKSVGVNSATVSDGNAPRVAAVDCHATRGLFIELRRYRA